MTNMWVYCHRCSYLLPCTQAITKPTLEVHGEHPTPGNMAGRAPEVIWESFKTVWSVNKHFSFQILSLVLCAHFITSVLNESSDLVDCMVVIWVAICCLSLWDRGVWPRLGTGVSLAMLKMLNLTAFSSQVYKILYPLVLRLAMLLLHKCPLSLCTLAGAAPPLFRLTLDTHDFLYFPWDLQTPHVSF